MKDTRIGVVVFRSILGDLESNLKRTRKWIRQAAELHANLVVFPELSLTGYSSGEEVVRTAQTIDGPASISMMQTAEAENVTILAGMTMAGNNDAVHSAHVVYSPGKQPQIYKKIHIAPTEKSVFTPGNNIPLFDIDGFVFGIQLCYDAHFPELTTYMAESGADAVIIPHASPRGTPEFKRRSWMRHLPARAYDNGLFVVACNQAGDNGNGMNFPGVAMVFSPLGEIMAQHIGREESLLVCDLTDHDLKTVRESRMGYFFPHRRPELYIRG